MQTSEDMTSTRENKAAYLDAPDTPFRIAEAPIGRPAPHEVLIKIHAVAINPADHARQTLGLFINEYPWIFGCDGAGTIEDLGSDIKSEGRLRAGDRVIGLSDEFRSRKTTNAMFQNWVTCEGRAVCKIPDMMSYEEGVVLPLGLSTAAGMLFEKETLGLRLPSLESKGLADSKQVVVVWGGSSSVGACAIQLATAAGYVVVGIASSNNFALMRECGACATFDYADADMVNQLCKFVEEKGWRSAGVIAAVSTEATLQGCGWIAANLPGRKFVSTSLPRIIMPEPEMPNGVEASNCLGLSDPELFHYIWKKYTPIALVSGQLKCLPHAEIVGNGIEDIEKACDILRKGVSGKKIVVRIA